MSNVLENKRSITIILQYFILYNICRYNLYVRCLRYFHIQILFKLVKWNCSFSSFCIYYMYIFKATQNTAIKTKMKKNKKKKNEMEHTGRISIWPSNTHADTHPVKLPETWFFLSVQKFHIDSNIPHTLLLLWNKIFSNNFFCWIAEHICSCSQSVFPLQSNTFSYYKAQLYDWIILYK